MGYYTPPKHGGTGIDASAATKRQIFQATATGVFGLTAGPEFEYVWVVDPSTEVPVAAITSVMGVGYAYVLGEAGASGAELHGHNGGNVITRTLELRDTDKSHVLVISLGSNLTADRTLNLVTGDNNRTLDISAASVTITAFGASLIDDANAAAARATLGMGVNDILTIGGLNTTKRLNHQAITNFHLYERLGAGLSGTNAAGAIKITMPGSWTTTTFVIKIAATEGNSNKPYWVATIIGQNSAATSAWANAAATIEGRTTFTSVRLGHDGTNCCIVLGTTADNFQAYRIAVAEVIAGGLGADQWGDNWTVERITDTSGITFSATPTPVRRASALASADQAAVTLGNTDNEIGGLTIGATYSQSEVQALRDKCEELADDVRALSTLIHALRSAMVTTQDIKGAA